MTARRLIVNADDYGLAAAVGRGIEAAVAAGSVTSVSVLANLVEPAGLRALVATAPAPSIAAHLNLTTGRPVLPAATVASLVDRGGEFHALPELTRRAFTRRLRRAELEAELTAQLGVLAAAGVAVDHLDSHEHVHLLPGVLGPVMALARRAGIARLRTHRPCLLGGGGRGAIVHYYRRHPRRIFTHAVKHVLAARLRRAGVWMPDGMVAASLLLEPVAGGPLAEWRAVCAALPAGTWELVVHPADLRVSRTAVETSRLGDLVERRAAELAALRSPAFHEMIGAAGVTLVTFAGAPVDRGARAEAHARRRA